jgi:hypothetical protein
MQSKDFESQTNTSTQLPGTRLLLMMPWNRCRLGSSTFREMMCLRDLFIADDNDMSDEIADELNMSGVNRGNNPENISFEP